MIYAWWVIGFIALILAVDWRIAKKKKGHVDAVDRKRFTGTLGIGAVLAAIAWFVHWSG